MRPDWQTHVARAGALLFDFDGTLAPNLDLPDLRRRVTELALCHGVPAAAFADRYIVEILDAASAWLAGRDPAAAQALHAEGHRLIRAFELDAATRTEPFADARPLLHALRRHDKALAVVTRNCREAVLATFPDLPEYCDRLLARDDVAYLKPDRRHLLQALTELGHDPGGAVMIGDGALDMRIGKAVGMYCIGVLTGSSDADRLTGAGADAVVARAGELTAGW